jgi:hypothetical protein
MTTALSLDAILAESDEELDFGDAPSLDDILNEKDSMKEEPVFEERHPASPAAISATPATQPSSPAASRSSLSVGKTTVAVSTQGTAAGAVAASNLSLSSILSDTTEEDSNSMAESDAEDPQQLDAMLRAYILEDNVR